jgi:hypothetical protein
LVVSYYPTVRETEVPLYYRTIAIQHSWHNLLSVSPILFPISESFQSQSPPIFSPSPPSTCRSMELDPVSKCCPFVPTSSCLISNTTVSIYGTGESSGSCGARKGRRRRPDSSTRGDQGAVECGGRQVGRFSLLRFSLFVYSGPRKKVLAEFHRNFRNYVFTSEARNKKYR